MSKHSVSGGDVAALLDRFAQLQEKVQSRTGNQLPIVSIQEAGLDGFWIDRVLKANGIESKNHDQRWHPDYSGSGENGASNECSVRVKAETGRRAWNSPRSRSEQNQMVNGPACEACHRQD